MTHPIVHLAAHSRRRPTVGGGAGNGGLLDDRRPPAACTTPSEGKAGQQGPLGQLYHAGGVALNGHLPASGVRWYAEHSAGVVGRVMQTGQQAACGTVIVVRQRDRVHVDDQGRLELGPIA